MGRASRAHPRLVVEKLRQAGLTAKPSKCCRGVASLSYLRHVVGKGQVSVPECKVKSSREFVKPVTKKRSAILYWYYWGLQEIHTRLFLMSS